MAKFHINSKTGEPGACQATQGKCPFGWEDNHYTSKQAARDAFEGLETDSGLSAVSKSKLSGMTDAEARAYSESGERPDHDSRSALRIASNELQDFTEQYHGKAEWAAMKQNPALMHKFAGLELAHADADLRLTEMIMAAEVLRHANAGADDSYDQKQHQSNLIIRLSDKVAARLWKVRQLGGDAGVQAAISKSAALLAAMDAQGAKNDERSKLYYTFNLTHAQLLSHEVHHQLRENRVPGMPHDHGLSPRTSQASIRSMSRQADLLLQMADADRSTSAANRALFPYNKEF